MRATGWERWRTPVRPIGWESWPTPARAPVYSRARMLSHTPCAPSISCTRPPAASLPR